MLVMDLIVFGVNDNLMRGGRYHCDRIGSVNKCTYTSLVIYNYSFNTKDIHHHFIVTNQARFILDNDLPRKINEEYRIASPNAYTHLESENNLSSALIPAYPACLFPQY